MATGYKRAQFDSAMLSLFHPVTPDVEKALQYVLTLANQKNVRELEFALKQPKHTVSLCLRLAHCLIDQGRIVDATRILQFTQTHFPNRLGDHVGTSDSKVKANASTKEAEISARDERKYMEALDSLLAT